MKADDRLDEVRALYVKLAVSSDQPDDDAEPLADALFERVAPFFDRFGLTRVGSLTSLDTIGIPVWFATRPNSRSLAVSQGKGLDDAQARISAVMESLEQAVAERPKRFVSEFGSISDMERRDQIVPLAEMMRCIRPDLDPAGERAWVRGLSLVTGEAVLAPYELVGLDMRSDAPWDRDAFRFSSIGLASGAALAPAALHALCEVIENDATAPLQALTFRLPTSQPLLPGTGTSADLDAAIALVQQAGLQLAFYDIASDIALPTILCTIERDVMTGEGAGIRRSAGVACHPNAPRAALAALLEAVQTRLTYISGARDDIGPDQYAVHMDATGARRAAIGDRSPIRSEWNGGSDKGPIGGPIGLLRQALNALKEAGIRQVYVFPLGGEELGIRVVRMLVPNLEAALEQGPIRLGARGLAAMGRMAAA